MLNKESYQTLVNEKGPPWLYQGTLFLQVGGSHAYGLATETSDYDYRGVAIAPFEYYTHPFKRFEQFETHEPYDLVIYNLDKFVKLAADCNPNIIEILFADASTYVMSPFSYGFPLDHLHPLYRHQKIFKLLLKNRDKFLSQKAAHTFTGYAMAQLKRIKGHRKWLLNPPIHKPERKEFGLMEQAKMSKDIVGAIDNLRDKDTIPAEVMTLYRAESEYLNAKRVWDQYNEWKKSRNPKRAELEAKCGYDSKHAMHLVRLLRMGWEILTTGQVIVKRPDREELLAIRNGAWSYDQVVEYAERMDNGVKEALNSTKLPYSADKDFLGNLVVDCIRSLG